MMRKILITVFALLMTVSASYAVEMNLTGSMMVEGVYENNYAQAADDTYSWMYYGQELKVTVDLKISDATKITTRFDIYTDNESSYVWGTEGIEYDTPEQSILTAKRAYMTHVFPTKTTMKLGLMDGSQWASTFADNKTGRWRVYLQQETPFGHVFGVLEKHVEMGRDAANEDAETDDMDLYYVAAITKLADIVYIKPLFAYGSLGSLDPINGEVDGTRFAFDLGWDGTLEDLGIGFEGEFVYDVTSLDEDYMDTDDLVKMGFYINGWYNIEPATVGMWIAYGSFDEDTGAAFQFADDFDSTTILGDDLGGRIWDGLISQLPPAEAAFLSAVIDANTPEDLMGMTAIQLYADITVPSLEKLTVSPSFTYAMSNIEDDDTTAFEFDLDCAYKITDALTYSAGFAYASITYDISGIDDPDGLMKLYHNFEISF